MGHSVSQQTLKTGRWPGGRREDTVGSAPAGSAPDVRSPTPTLRLLVAGAVTLIVVAIARAFFPDYVFHWDEVQLTLGLERFDLRSHQPHPPGYYLFVFLGRLLRPFMDVPENALRTVATLAGGSFVILVARRLPTGMKPWAGSVLVVAAGAFVVCSPIVFFHSVSALTYTIEAACWLAILLVAADRPTGWRLFVLAAGIGLAGGLRQTLTVWGVMLIALVWVRHRSWMDLRTLLLVIVALVIGVALWAVPMLVEVGGVGEYVRLSGPLLRGNIWEASVVHQGPAAFGARLVRMLTDLWLACGPLLIVTVAGLFVRFTRGFRDRLARWDLLPIGAGLAFLFYAVLIYDSDGYILPVAVPLAAHGLLVTGEIVTSRSGRVQFAGTVALLLLAVSLMVLPGGFASSADRGYKLHAKHDAALRARIETISRNFRPETTVLVTSHEYWQWSFRHVMYYLPRFTTLQLIPDRFFVEAGTAQPYLTARGQRIRFTGPDGFDVRSLGESVEQVVYVIPHDVTQFVSPSCAPFLRPVPTSPTETIGVLRLSETYEVRVQQARLHCGRRASSRPAG